MHSTKLFDDWSKKYEKDILRLKDDYPFAGYFDHVKFLRTTAQKDTCKTILDIGVGSGFMLNKIVESSDCRYVGLDFSAKMLEIAGSKLDPIYLLHWDLSVNEIPLPLQKRNFDLIVSAYTLHHFKLDKQIEIIQLYKELLTENGQLIIADIAFDNEEELKKVKKQAGAAWDKQEEKGYFINDLFVYKCEDVGLKITSNKVSFCSYRYVIS